MSADVRDIAESGLEVMTEAELARRREAEGSKTTCHGGRHWERTFAGFWQPVHVLARLRPAEATRPSMLCWGFRATLDSASRDGANGTIPLHVLSDVASCTAESLGGKQRWHLKKCRKAVRIARVMTPDVLLAGGYEIAASAKQRTGYDQLPHLGKQGYEAFARRVAADPKYVVLAGFVGETLAGYLVGMAVGDVAYVNNVQIATEHLPTSIGTGLVFDFVQMCRRTAGVTSIVYGLHAPEDGGLTGFKERMGFGVVNVPARLWLAPGVRGYIRRRHPFKYYRLSGEPPAAVSEGGATARAPLPG